MSLFESFNLSFCSVPPLSFLQSSRFVLDDQTCLWRPFYKRHWSSSWWWQTHSLVNFNSKIIILYNFVILYNTGFGGSPVVINGSAWVYSWFVRAGNVILMALFTWHMSAKALHPQQGGGRLPFIPSWMVVCYFCNHICVLGRLTKALQAFI